MAGCSTGVLIWHKNKIKYFLLMYLAGSENRECVVHGAFSLTENQCYIREYDRGWDSPAVTEN